MAVVQGDDLAALLPHEMMGFRVPALRRDTVARLAEGSLLQFEMEGDDRAARGPVVLVVDSSGSMRGPRIEWAKATALALVALAHRERRDAAVVEFSSDGQLRTFTYPHRRFDPEDLVEMAAHHFGGGTETSAGMAEAPRCVEEAPAFRQADLVLVTDGADRFEDDDERVRGRLRALSVRVQGVAIARAPSQYMNLTCDSAVSVHDLDAPGKVTREIARRLSPP